MKTNRIKRLLISAILIFNFLVFGNCINVFAADIAPNDNQYLELRAVEIKEVDGQNKQVIMQLWGNNLVFKRI